MLKSDKLISTAIMKTDITGFTSIVGDLADFELSKLLEEHKKFIIRIIYKYDGSIIKGEGDAFIISFSSVTSAIESAIEIQNTLKDERRKSDSKFRLSLKIMISLGDVMHKENDVFGESVNIVSRIENITPSDEIYISEPAFLTSSKKHINFELVGNFQFKGFNQKQNIYKVVLGQKTLIQTNQFILFSDLQNFQSTRNDYALFELNIDNSEVMFRHIIKQYNGNLRNVLGDAHLMTFNTIEDLIESIDYIHSCWTDVSKKHGLCKMRLGTHKGTINVYRSCIAGNSFNIAARLESIGKNLSENNNPDIQVVTHASSVIYDEAIKYNQSLENKFRKVPSKEILTNLTDERKKDFKRNVGKSTYSYISSSNQ